MQQKLRIKGKARQVFAIISEMAQLHPKTSIKDLP